MRTAAMQNKINFKYPLLNWAIPIVFTPILFFTVQIITLDGDKEQFMDGKYWYIVFAMTYILQGMLISLPVLLVNLFVYRKLILIKTSAYIIRFIIGAIGILSAFTIIFFTLSKNSTLLLYYSIIILMSSLLIKMAPASEKQT